MWPGWHKHFFCFFSLWMLASISILSPVSGSHLYCSINCFPWDAVQMKFKVFFLQLQLQSTDTLNVRMANSLQRCSLCSLLALPLTLLLIILANKFPLWVRVFPAPPIQSYTALTFYSVGFVAWWWWTAEAISSCVHNLSEKVRR